MTIDYHWHELAEYDKRLAAQDAHDAALDHAACDIYEALDAGGEIICGSYSASYTDYSMWCGEMGIPNTAASLMHYAKQHAEDRLAYTRGEK